MVSLPEQDHRPRSPCSKMPQWLIAAGGLLLVMYNCHSFIPQDLLVTDYDCKDVSPTRDIAQSEHRLVGTGKFINVSVPSPRSKQAKTPAFEVQEPSNEHEPTKLLVQTIPSLMFLIQGGKVVYCPAAKAGSSSIHGSWGLKRCQTARNCDRLVSVNIWRNETFPRYGCWVLSLGCEIFAFDEEMGTSICFVAGSSWNR